MPTMRAHFQRHLFPGLRDLIFSAYKEQTPAYASLLRTETSDKAFEEFRSMAGVGLFVRTPENVEGAQDRFFDGFPKRFQHDDYSLMIGFSWQAQRDLKTRIFGERSRELGISARQTRETLNAAPFNQAFDGGVVGPDGVALCANNHPNIRGGTQSNILDPAGTVSITTIRAMLTKARRYVDDTGVRRIMLDLRYLIIPPEEEFVADEILKSAGRPDTANRADNVLRNRLTPHIHNYLEDTNNFFALSDKAQHRIYVFTREDFGIDEFEEEKPRINWIRATFAQSVGWAHWMGIIGSNPAS